MSDTDIRRIPIVSLFDPRYYHLARRLSFPPSSLLRHEELHPTFASFEVGDGEVNVSFAYTLRSDPRNDLVRHLRTEAIVVPLDGDLCLPLAAAGSDDPSEEPGLDEIVCAVVPRGEAIVLRKNVWHNPGWPVDGERGVRYLMLLSGQRTGGGREPDRASEQLPDGISIIPDWGSLQP